VNYFHCLISHWFYHIFAHLLVGCHILCSIKTFSYRKWSYLVIWDSDSYKTKQLQVIVFLNGNGISGVIVTKQVVQLFLFVMFKQSSYFTEYYQFLIILEFGMLWKYAKLLFQSWIIVTRVNGFLEVDHVYVSECHFACHAFSLNEVIYLACTACCCIAYFWHIAKQTQ